jgi:hypothetical protein
MPGDLNGDHARNTTANRAHVRACVHVPWHLDIVPGHHGST